MTKLSSFKHKFISSFREIFVHHHGSLEFRAKTFALIIASFEDCTKDNTDAYNAVKDFGMKIYEDNNRANLLVITTKELVKKVYDKNGLDIDTLITNIQKELRIVPRYAKKIDIDSLKTILTLTKDDDTLSYQENIIGFLQNLKEETLNSNQEDIKKSEESIRSKYISK